MLSAYTLQELIRRLSPEHARTIARGFGIDPDQRLPHLDPPFRDRHELSGALDFDLTIGAFGACVSVPARLSWTADLADDEDEATDEPIRVLGQCVMMLHALIWDLDEPHPHWSRLDIGILPPAVMAAIDDRVEEQARALELGS